MNGTNQKKPAYSAIDDGYCFRLGMNGDRSASGYITVPKRPPEFILELDGEQIGAAHGSDCCIDQIEIFEDKVPHNNGHGTKFVELWESYAKQVGCGRLEVVKVSSNALAHILLDKRGFKFQGETKIYGRCYTK